MKKLNFVPAIFLALSLLLVSIGSSPAIAAGEPCPSNGTWPAGCVPGGNGWNKPAPAQPSGNGQPCPSNGAWPAGCVPGGNGWNKPAPTQPSGNGQPCPSNGAWPAGCVPGGNGWNKPAPAQPSGNGQPCPSNGAWPAGCVPGGSSQPASPPAWQQPSAPAAPVQETQVYSGNGSKVIDLKDRARRMSILEMSVSQPRTNFIVRLLDEEGELVDLAANEIVSTWKGEILVDRSRQNNIRYVEIDSEGSWTLKFKPTSEALPLSRPGTLRGSQDSVVLSVKGGGIVKLQYSGAVDDGRPSGGNFIVISYDGSGRRLRSLANEIGSWSGESVMPSDARFVEILADGGNWVINHQ